MTTLLSRTLFSGLTVALWACLVALCVSLCAGCGGDDERLRKQQMEDELDRRMQGVQDSGPSTRFDNENFEVRSFDLNDDNVADLWKILSSEKENVDDQDVTVKMVRKEFDSNFDGEVDIWFFYNSKELLLREEADADFNGYIDLVLHYDNGVVIKRELFMPESSAPQVTKHYRQRALYKVEIDDNSDGNIERWELYSAGRLLQVGHDVDNDGKVDYWDSYEK